MTSSENEYDVIRIGVYSSHEFDLWEYVGKNLAEEGIDIEPVQLSDFASPNLSLADGSLEANAYQYIPFLYEYNKVNNTNLLPIGYLSAPPMGIWAIDGIDTIEDIPKGASVTIYNDPTNLGNSLIQLEKAGLITLSEDAATLPIQDDIIDNPLELKFIETDPAIIPRTLGDNELIVMGSRIAGESGFDIEDAFYFEDPNEVGYQYRLNFVVREEDVDNEIMHRIIEEYQTDELVEYANSISEAEFYPGWKNDDDPVQDYYKFKEIRESE